MNQKAFVEAFSAARASAILRTSHEHLAASAMEAAIDAGFQVVEFTMTIPGALDLVRQFAKRDGLLVSVGTVLTPEDAHAAIDAGASCLVSPVLGTEVGEVAAERDVAWMPGVATPTEAYAAHQTGAPLQKIFPMPGIGAAWVKAIRGPMPFLNLVPTHGVHENNAASFLKAGAHAVGFVQSVFDPNDIAEQRWNRIKEKAERALASVV
ncbi:MAG: hypothetical protein CBD11_03250 [Phycisphaera sp. TMED151]|nr:MAG: hypothetical protein CBD11_03250 [Phycisphaera sp. TMED151]